MAIQRFQKMPTLSQNIKNSIQTDCHIDLTPLNDSNI
jgi:hypothetical protein